MSGTACLHSARGAGPESILGVNYHVGREDLGISASQFGTPHHQHSIDSGSKPGLLAQLLPLDSASGHWFQMFSFGLSVSR